MSLLSWLFSKKTITPVVPLEPVKHDPIPPSDPTPWLTVARKYVGLHEIVGPHHNCEVIQLWADAHADKVHDDETPWCSAYVSACIERAGITSTRSGWARSYLNWGRAMKEPAVGSIVVFSRGKGLGHVGIVVGQTKGGHLMVLGGNQDDAVSIKSFARDRVLSYRWPTTYPMPLNPVLPTLGSCGKLSVNEA